MSSSNDLIHIDENIRLSWGTIRVQCDIPTSDPSLEANLRASIRFNAGSARSKEDRVALEKVIALNFEDVRHLHVDISPLDPSIESSLVPSPAG